MKRTIAILLIGTLLSPAALIAQTTVRLNGLPALVPLADGEMSNSESYNMGVLAAEEEHSAVGWGFGGFFAGGFFSWLGTGVTVLIAGGSHSSPQFLPDNVEPMSYRAGYRHGARRKNIRAAAIPGVVMSTLWTILVIGATSR